MKRTFAIVGATLLLSFAVFDNIGLKAIKAVFITAFVALFIFLLFKRTRFDGTLPVVAFTLCVGCLVFGFYSLSVEKTITPFKENNKAHTVSGEIISLPEEKNSRAYYIIRTDSIDGKNISTKIRLSLKEKLAASPDDKLTGEFYLYTLGKGNEEIEDYYSSKGLFLGGYCVGEENIRITGRSDFSLMNFVLNAKQAVKDSINCALPNEYGGLLTGFLLGERGDINEKTLNAFSLIGSYHLLAVSGLHVTVWAGFVFAFLTSLRLRRRTVSILTILFILFFIALTGFNPPVVRAGVLMIFLFLGKFFRREADSINSIGIALTVMLVVNPFSVRSKGLWLSTFASVGIILLAGPIFNKLSGNKKLSPQPDAEEQNKSALSKAKEFVLKSFSVTLAATLFTLPLNLLFFDRFSLITPLANLLLIEISSLAMLITGFASIFSIIALKFISNPLFFVAGFAAKIISDIARFLSSFDLITVSTRYYPLVIWTVVLMLTGVLLFILHKAGKEIKKKLLCVLLSASFVFVCLAGAYSEKKSFKLYVASVGDGISVIIRNENNTALIGCGGDRFAYYRVCDIMNKNGVSTVDYLFIPRHENLFDSFGEEIEDRYYIGELHDEEYSDVTLWGKIGLSCRRDYSFLKYGDFTALVVFDPYMDFRSVPEEYLNADCLISREKYPVNLKNKNFSFIIISCQQRIDSPETMSYTDTGSLCLEVKNDGRARLKTAD